MLYDAFLSRGGAERRVSLPTNTVLKPGDEFKFELEVYAVTTVQPGHDDFDAVLSADLIGDKPE